jgi:hypothetical protein
MGMCAGNASFSPTNYTEDVDQAIGASTTIITSGKDSGTSGSRTYTITQNAICDQPLGAFAAWSP